MSKRPSCVWLGFDPREASAFAVARQSIRRWNKQIPVNGLVFSHLERIGLYNRPTERRLGRLWDVISEAPMSTEFAITRFLVPSMMWDGFAPWDEVGWAIFMDCDVLVRTNLSKMIWAWTTRRRCTASSTPTFPTPRSRWTGKYRRSTRARTGRP